MTWPSVIEWAPTRLKYIAGCNLEVLAESTDAEYEFAYIDIGSVTQGRMMTPVALTRFGAAPSRARRLAEVGDSVISTVRTYLRAVASVPEHDDPLVFSTGFAVLHPREAVRPRFLAWYLQGDEFVTRIEALSTGVSYPAITAEDIMAMSLRLPPLHQQEAIADYLDRETAQIDTLIAKQEQLIATLRERNQSVAELVVGTRVGVGRRLKGQLHERDERAGTGWESLPLLAVSISWGVRRRDEITDDPPRSEDLSTYKIAHAGDIVINRMRAFQGALGVAPTDGIVSPDYAVLRCPDSAEASWMELVMRTKRFTSEMARRLKGIGGVDSGFVRTPRINVTDLLDIRVDIPDVHIQEAERDAISARLNEVDTLIAKAEQFIALARERRSALITAAVTGQIDVRVAA